MNSGFFCSGENCFYPLKKKKKDKSVFSPERQLQQISFPELIHLRGAICTEEGSFTEKLQKVI